MRKTGIKTLSGICLALSLMCISVPLSVRADTEASYEAYEDSPKIYYSEAESEEAKAAKSEVKESIAAEINETALKSAEKASAFSHYFSGILFLAVVLTSGCGRF